MAVPPPRRGVRRRPGVGQLDIFGGEVGGRAPTPPAAPTAPAAPTPPAGPIGGVGSQPWARRGYPQVPTDPGERNQPTNVGTNYRRAEITPADEGGYVWVQPSPSIEPDRPRTHVIGYNLQEKKLRMRFRDGTTWAYEDIPPEIWERFRRTRSTGKLMLRVGMGRGAGNPEAF